MSKSKYRDDDYSRKPVLTFDPRTIIPTLIPPNTSLPTINPEQYYITTGEAVAKTRQLQSDITQLKQSYLLQQSPIPPATQGEIAPGEPGEQDAFIAQCVQAEHQIEAFINHLIATRGKAYWLQCEHIDGQCVCWQKNPREEMARLYQNARRRLGETL